MTRPIQILVAIVFLAACGEDAPANRGREAPAAAAAARSDAGAVTPLQPGEDSATAPNARSASGAPPADGVAELQRLAAAGKPILLDGYQEVLAGEFVVDTATAPSTYAGDYHFGDSEGESTLSLEVRGNAVTGALGYADWENETWVGKEVKLDGGTISGATLSAPGWSGVFVRFQGQPGLVILKAPDVLGVEFGEKQDPQ